MIDVAIVGGSGYTGAELLRLLSGHPEVRIRAVTARQAVGTRVDDWFEHLRGHVDLHFVDAQAAELAECDVVFFATPHGTAMHQAPALLDAGVRVIDLSADFRLRDADVFAQYYGEPHAAPQWLARAVYALPEVAGRALADAQLIACPGCYPTAVQLAVLPLAEAGLLSNDPVIADCKSGASGGGRAAKPGLLLAETGDNVKAYGVGTHRHTPEIAQGVSHAAGRSVDVIFTPHLMPMIRGIHATVYLRIEDAEAGVQAVYQRRYAETPFVDVLPVGRHPETRSVRGANVCRIAVHQQGDRVIVLSVIDNLVKGASGQAVQAMNLAFGLDETLGLAAPALLP